MSDPARSFVAEAVAGAVTMAVAGTVAGGKAGVMALALILGPTLAAGQGVPILDAEALQRNIAILLHQEKDAAVQTAKTTTREKLDTIKAEQLAALDALLKAVKPETSTASMVASLEAGSGGARPARDLYAPDDQNPAAARLFGDAKVTVEQVIVEASKATYGHPGVAKAGLSRVQWRCLLQALIWQESRFNPHAQSPAGAYGLTQIMPGTAADLGIAATYRADPFVQAEGGGRYLGQMLDMFRGDVVWALAAYNAGPGNVQKHGGVPPFAETQHYVQVIPAKYNAYLGTVGGIDALGTIEPMLAAGANVAMTSGGSAVYADATYREIRAAAARIRSIVERIDGTATPNEAMALNTYARAELARLLVLRARLRAASAHPVGAKAIETAVITASERRMLSFGE